jgi:N-acetylglucosamine-6-phosphate deacetylase
MEATPEAIEAIAEDAARRGTTSFLPTLISAPRELLEEGLSAISKARGRARGVAILGAHLEGPFLNPKVSGAHPKGHLRPPDPGELGGYAQSWGGGPLVLTLAPELPGALSIIRRVADLGWIPALGHSAATYEEARLAIASGARLATHTFNAMGGFHHREPGVLGAILDSPEVMAGFIADGVHVHPAALRMAIRAKGGKSTFLVSDATPLGEGEVSQAFMGEVWVRLREGRAETRDGVLAGALLSLRGALRKGMEFCQLPLEGVLPWVSENPARALNLAHRKGRLAEGLDADILVMDQDLEVLLVFVEGELLLDRR